MEHRRASLDGLRAVCVAAVFASGFHWLVPFGWIGVQVFYVLSGFLITQILESEREHAATGKIFFSRFYTRRSLRIFPLYFAYLSLLQIASMFWPHAVTDWSAARGYAATFTTNIGLMHKAFRVTEETGHLWSLALEEQFYLLWPLVLWFAPPKATRLLALALVALGPLIRWTGERAFGLTYGQTYLASTSHVDAFALGALVPWIDARMKSLPSVSLVTLLITLALGLWVQQSCDLALRTLGYPEGLYAGQAHTWGYSLININAALLVACLLRGHLQALAHPALAYVGRISFAVYLFQRPIKGIHLTLIEPALLRVMPVWLAYCIGAALCLTLALAFAALSNRFLERPLLAWRDRIAPRGQAPAPVNATS